LIAVACERQAVPGAAPAGGGAAGGPASTEASAFLDEGLSWLKRAETAPLPTPPPLLAPLPKGAAPPPAPEFKPEEIQAASFFEKAIAAQPADPRPHMALAQLLAPHAVHRRELEEQAAWRKKPARGKGRPTPEPAPTPDPSGIDYSVERIVRSYETAIQNDPTNKQAVDALINFSVKVGALEAADGAFQELTKRIKESPEPFLRYGDFLLDVKKDPEAAIEAYRQALIWKPDDEKTRDKVAGIYIDMGAAAWGQKQYAIAQSRFAEAGKYADKDSAQGRRLQDYLSRLRDIRGR
jgi:tetratricopeptide (TPR) repeat protein